MEINSVALRLSTGKGCATSKSLRILAHYPGTLLRSLYKALPLSTVEALTLRHDAPNVDLMDLLYEMPRLRLLRAHKCSLLTLLEALGDKCTDINYPLARVPVLKISDLLHINTGMASYKEKYWQQPLQPRVKIARIVRNGRDDGSMAVVHLIQTAMRVPDDRFCSKEHDDYDDSDNYLSDDDGDSIESE